MTPRYLALGVTALALALSGCATQPTGVEPGDPLNQRLGSLEYIAGMAREQGLATQSQVGDLARKLDAMAGDISREMARQRDSQIAEQRVREAALLDRLNDTESRLTELAGQSRGGLAGMKDKVDETDPPVAERLDQAEETLAEMEEQLDELTAQAEEGKAEAAALKTALAPLAPLGDKLAESAARVDGLDARLARIEKRLEEVAAMALDALDATGMGQRRILGKVVHSITLTEDKTLFPINSPVLGDVDMAKLNELAAKVKAMGTHYHLQIQGHTDGFGSEDYNYDLGRARAEVVKGYLNEKGGIPLLRMSVISHGASEAASYSGKTNRRIVVHVLQ